MMQGQGVLTQQTRRFIDENPVDVTFVRHVGADDGAGGKTYDNEPLAAQTVRIVEAAANALTVERRNVEGKVVRPDLHMVTMPDADLQVGDTFVWNANTVEVVWVTDLGYELMADVAAR